MKKRGPQVGRDQFVDRPDFVGSIGLFLRDLGADAREQARQPVLRVEPHEVVRQRDGIRPGRGSRPAARTRRGGLRSAGSQRPARQRGGLGQVAVGGTFGEQAVALGGRLVSGRKTRSAHEQRGHQPGRETQTGNHGEQEEKAAGTSRRFPQRLAQLGQKGNGVVGPRGRTPTRQPGGPARRLNPWIPFRLRCLPACRRRVLPRIRPEAGCSSSSARA